MAGSTAATLLRSVGLEPVGPVPWGTAPRSTRSGVYVVETREALREAPIDSVLVEGWLERVPTLHLNGSRPTAARLAERLGEFWVPGQRIVYIGLTTASLARRVRNYYRTPLGDRRPHAGGHWIRTLHGVEEFDVWWSETDAPGEFEDVLLRGFAQLIPRAIRPRVCGSDIALLPFANKQNASATVRKPHGITGSLLRGSPAQSVSSPIPAAKGARAVGDGARARAPLTIINEALQAMACAEKARRIAAVPAAAGLERRGLLPDSRQRRGKPLRDLLRAGDIEHAYQEPNGRWWITCANDGVDGD